MKILFAASEAAPFVKTGGLGDVAGSLPLELSRSKDLEVCVILPYYGSIKHDGITNAEYIGSVYVPLAWRNVYAGVFKKTVRAQGSEVVYYFIDNDYYFDRNSCYGHCDDGERFAFFSKAILECIPLTGFYPDVIHTNDWQTGFVPLFLKAHYQSIEAYRSIKTVFTIHNIEYQGKADPPFLTDVLGVDEHLRNICTFDNLINAMKTAIVLCDRLTTVSETYSHEIRYAYFANGLETVINENAYKLSGTVNGIDCRLYNPEHDSRICAPYSAKSPAGKKKCKEALQKELGLEVNEHIPIVSMITRLVNHKGLELVEAVANEIAGGNLQFVVLGTGDARYEDMMRFLEYSNNSRVRALITFDAALAQRIYSGSDFLLMPSKSEPCGLSQLIAMRYGTIPIVRETGGLVDTVEPINPETKTGSGITFKVFNAHDMLDAIWRACDIYKSEEIINAVRKNIMKYDSSWKGPAMRYMDIYRSLMT